MKNTQTEAEIISRLNYISSYYSFINVINFYVLDDLHKNDPNDHRSSREKLNVNEISFLVGLWIKNIDLDNDIESQEEFDKILSETKPLMNRLHEVSFLKTLKRDDSTLYDMYKYASNGDKLKEAMFYEGTGAYDDQYTKWVIEKYRNDRDWLKTNKSIELENFPIFYNYLRKILQSKADNAASFDDLLQSAILNSEEIYGKNNIFKPIVSLLSTKLGVTTNDLLLNVGDLNVFNSRPIIELPDGKFYVPLVYIVSEALYESPFYWMLNDKKYKLSTKNRGESAENITYQILSNLFDEKEIYRNVLINETKGKQVTDIDLLVIHDQTAIIFQIKSKKLTSLSKQGKIDNIKNDFQKAVVDAFEQGIVSKECLINHNNYTFNYASSSGINFDIKNYHIVTIVLDHYPAITHQSHIFLGQENDILPVTISIFDLEMLGKHLKKPERFVDYIERRTRFSKYYIADNEMCYLGFHLNEGLKKHADSTMCMIDSSYATLIDKTYKSERLASLPKLPKKKKIGRNDQCPCGSGLKFKKCCVKL